MTSPNLQVSVEIINIEECSWRQFLTLANKVTGVVADCKLREASMERIKLAKQTFGGEPFDQVTTLEMGIDHAPHVLINLFTTPYLNSVSLWFTTAENNSFAWAVYDLPLMAPNITHFCISLGPSHCLDVSQYSALQDFELIGLIVTIQLWESLATCQRLRNVGLAGCIAAEEDWSANQHADLVRFPALCTLKIRCGHSRVMRRLILRSHMPMLETLRWDNEPVIADSFIDQIAKHLKQYSPKIRTGLLYGPKSFMCHFGIGEYDDSAIDTDAESGNDSDGSEICY